MGGGDGALLDELLARQARAHGLAAWRPAAGDAADADTRAQLAEEAERLATFAGMRGGRDADGRGAADASDSDEGGGAPRPLSALADAAGDAAALEALGLDALKAELQRLGLKCGGTLQVRRARAAGCTGRAGVRTLTQPRRSVRHACSL